MKVSEAYVNNENVPVQLQPCVDAHNAEVAANEKHIMALKLQAHIDGFGELNIQQVAEDNPEFYEEVRLAIATMGALKMEAGVLRRRIRSALNQQAKRDEQEEARKQTEYYGANGILARAFIKSQRQRTKAGVRKEVA